MAQHHISLVVDPEKQPMPLEADPVSDESIAAALDAAETERATDIAKMLALFNGIQHLDQESEPTRKHFAQWGWIAVRGSSFGSGQFRHVAVASQMAAQAAHDSDMHRHGLTGVDLLQEHHAGERLHWCFVADAAIQAYLGSLGRKYRAVEHVFKTAERMGL